MAVKMTLRKLRAELRKYADAGLIPKSDIDQLFRMLGDWVRGAQSNWQVDVRTTEPAKPTERAALGGYDTGPDGKLRRRSDSAGNAVTLLADGVTTVKHGLDVIRAALEELKPLSPEAAQAAIEKQARAANRCLLGCELRPGERLKRGLCWKHHQEQLRAERKEDDRRRRAEREEVATGTDGT